MPDDLWNEFGNAVSGEARERHPSVSRGASGLSACAAAVRAHGGGMEGSRSPGKVCDARAAPGNWRHLSRAQAAAKEKREAESRAAAAAVQEGRERAAAEEAAELARLKCACGGLHSCLFPSSTAAPRAKSPFAGKPLAAAEGLNPPRRPSLQPPGRRRRPRRPPTAPPPRPRRRPRSGRSRRSARRRGRSSTRSSRRLTSTCVSFPLSSAALRAFLLASGGVASVPAAVCLSVGARGRGGRQPRRAACRLPPSIAAQEQRKVMKEFGDS